MSVFIIFLYYTNLFGILQTNLYSILAFTGYICYNEPGRIEN